MSQNVLPAMKEIHISKAIKDPGLVQAMYEQLNDDFLFLDWTAKQHSAEVNYKNMTFIIKGTHEEWVLFFLMDYIPPKGEPSVIK